MLTRTVRSILESVVGEKSASPIVTLCYVTHGHEEDEEKFSSHVTRKKPFESSHYLWWQITQWTAHQISNAVCKMTVSNIPLTAFQELVKCPICLDYYKDPRLLPCSHTFCFICIKQLSVHSKPDSSSDGDDSDSGEDLKHPFHCPLKDGTTLEKHELKKLPVNRIAKTMVELFLTPYSKNGKNESQSYCDSCSENPSVRWCLECSRQFCRNCVVAHSRIPTHLTVTIADRACMSMQSAYRSSLKILV